MNVGTATNEPLIAYRKADILFIFTFIGNYLYKSVFLLKKNAKIYRGAVIFILWKGCPF